MMKFNSQICTTREQSERLIALGLKKETADCGIYYSEFSRCDRMFENRMFEKEELDTDDIPAWSLHRLLMMTTSKRKVMLIRRESDLFDVLIRMIEHEIKKGHFNKEYLENEDTTNIQNIIAK